MNPHIRLPLYTFGAALAGAFASGVGRSADLFSPVIAAVTSQVCGWLMLAAFFYLTAALVCTAFAWAFGSFPSSEDSNVSTKIDPRFS